MALNDENKTLFTNVDISKSKKDIVMEFTITDDASSKSILNIFILELKP